jgi:hypothetical protein
VIINKTNYPINKETQLFIKLKAHLSIFLSIYHSFYQNIPAEHCVIFIVDVSKDAILSKILSFAVPAIKEVLAKTDFD